MATGTRFVCIPTGILKETRGYVSSTDQVNRNFRLETLDYRIFSNIYDLILTDGIVYFSLDQIRTLLAVNRDFPLESG